MKRIVITGSSKGIGYGMATYFLEQGNMVVISGSSEQSTLKAYQELSIMFPETVFAKACDVCNLAQVEALADYAVHHMEAVDIWMNNAGVSHTSSPTYEIPEEAAHQVVDVNIHGVINGSKVAVNLFRHQEFGALYNMEGLGSDGRMAEGVGLYGATKSFLRYYSRVLEKEAKGQKYIVGRTSPGMVTTDLLMKDIDQSSDPEKTRRIFSILADNVRDVAPWLGQRVLENRRNGVLIAWLTTPKIIWRFMTSGFLKRNPFD